MLSFIVTRQVTIQEKSANQAVNLTLTPALFMKFCGRLSVHLYYIGHYKVGASDLCVRAPSEAWRILRCASPRRVIPSQSPVSSVACMAEALPGNLVGITQILKGHWESARSTIHHERHRLSEQDTRSVHRETCRP